MLKTGATVKARVFFNPNKNYTIGTLEIREVNSCEEYWVHEVNGECHHVLENFIEEVK